ncbi:MAG: hypothetical protein ACR2GF_02780 [Acidimicrobiales bacterium]
MTNDTFDDAREQLTGGFMLTTVEGDLLGEDPFRYAADVSDLHLLTSALAAWSACRDMVVGRRVLCDTYTETETADMVENYEFAQRELRRAVRQLADRWAAEDEEITR